MNPQGAATTDELRGGHWVTWRYLVCSSIILMALSAAYLSGAINKPENLALVVLVTSPVFAAFFLMWFGALRVLFGKRPLPVVEADGVRFPKIGLYISRSEVKRLRNMGILLSVELKQARPIYLKANLLFPVFLASRSTMLISVVQIAGGSEHSAQVLSRGLNPLANV